ncbi:MAG: nucleoid occlusion protein [Clostridiales bacterium]|jgi:ParB family chromosome partitioning protein|nr:nucleoid occlusion protein [Clostridiales bacterium]
MSQHIASREIIYLPLEKVRPNPYQPRRFFERGALEELADSIREYGVLQPVSVRLINGCSYELVAGERRLRACKIAGTQTIPAIVVNISDQDSAILAIIENLQRQNLHFFEEAEGFQNLMTDYGFTQEALAERIGKNQSTIANKLRILKLSKPLQRFIVENELTERHARALLRLDNDESQMEVLQKVVKLGLTVRKTEELVEDMLRKQANVKPVVTAIKHYIRDIRILANTIRENLETVKRSGIDTSFDMVQTDSGYDIHISLMYGA